MSTDGQHTLEAVAPVALRAHEDARDVIRLFQCPQCSYPLREPMTLPCGNSLCRPCLPALHKREHITYPLNEGRSEGFICPFKDCGLEHSMGDCSTDVTLSKIMELVKGYFKDHTLETSDAPLLLQEKLCWPNVVDSAMDVMPRARVLHGGRVIATYMLADMGELNYDSGLAYSPVVAGIDDGIESLDVAVVQGLRDVTRPELECQVCYAVMLDPLTTSCGHTYCRRCVARVLDHSNLCPICRRRLPLAPGVQGEPSNKKLTRIVQGLLADALATRLATTQLEDAVDTDINMPLFPCTLAFPMMPTFLHIFEPRYRLMIRRVMENGTRTFGILMYNQNRIPQGSLGTPHFMQYGTLLHIERLAMMQDGRSIIENRGMSRFKVLEWSMLDGYVVGKIQRVEDIPIAEEEAIEARETSGPEPAEEDFEAQIAHMSTQRLLENALEFVTRSRSRSAQWLNQRILDAHGQPPTDPAIFPYWFASILPITDEAKYTLLPTTSVRERLKISARWIQTLEAASREQEAVQRAREQAIFRVVADMGLVAGRLLQTTQSETSSSTTTPPSTPPDVTTTSTDNTPVETALPQAPTPLPQAPQQPPPNTQSHPEAESHN